MHTGHKTVPRAERRLICGKNPLQQQHRLANAQLAQLQGLIHGRDGKTVHIRERRQNIRHAMPVGIGFHHRNQLRRPCLLAQHPHIVAQRRHINHLHQRTHLALQKKERPHYSGLSEWRLRRAISGARQSAPYPSPAHTPWHYCGHCWQCGTSRRARPNACPAP